MPPNLRRAHQALDRAVDRLYRKSGFASEHERVEHLFMLYERCARLSKPARRADRNDVRAGKPPAPRPVVEPLSPNNAPQTTQATERSSKREGSGGAEVYQGSAVAHWYGAIILVEDSVIPTSMPTMWARGHGH